MTERPSTNNAIMTAARNIQSRRILITGAGRGIGRAISIRLACLGFETILWDRDSVALDEVADHCIRAGARVYAVPVDVGDAEQVKDAALRSLDSESLVGAIVNAGIAEFASIEDLEIDAWRSIIQTNLSGAFFTIKAALPRLVSGSQLVVIGSDSAHYAFTGRGAYCASKAGVAALIEVARREVRKRGVRVTQLFPSRVDSHFHGNTPGRRPDILNPRDLAEVVAILFQVTIHIEIRELSIASIHSSFGPYEECAPLDVP